MYYALDPTFTLDDGGTLLLTQQFVCQHLPGLYLLGHLGLTPAIEELLAKTRHVVFADNVDEAYMLLILYELRWIRQLLFDSISAPMPSTEEGKLVLHRLVCKLTVQSIWTGEEEPEYTCDLYHLFHYMWVYDQNHCTPVQACIPKSDAPVMKHVQLLLDTMNKLGYVK